MSNSCNIKNDPLFKFDKRDYDYSICRLRPTGRAKGYGDYINSYFDVDVRPYIIGLMTRFMLRFIVADTIEEINNYKKEFDGYLERYGHEFPESIKNTILKQYEDRKQLIKSGVVKPLSINFDKGFMENNPETAFNLYLQQAISSLKMFGFRNQEINGKYNVFVPEQYYRVKANSHYCTKSVSPVELILLWAWNEDYTYSYDREFYGIKNNEPPLKYLGSQYDDEDSFPDDIGYKTCEICGCSFSGDDTVCPSCANNID